MCYSRKRSIECDTFNRYYIETGLDDDLRIWLLNTFTVSNLVHESHSLKNRILLEEVPSGQRFLAAIIEAMRDEVCVDMNYHPFWLDEAIQMNDVKPLCLKIFRQRWYLIAENSIYSPQEIRRIICIISANIVFFAKIIALWQSTSINKIIGLISNGTINKFLFYWLQCVIYKEEFWVE